MKKHSDNYWLNLGMILLLAAVIFAFIAYFSTAKADDLVTYTTTADGKGNLTTYGSDGTTAFSAKCQTCARETYDTTYSDGTRSRTEQNGTNDDYTTTVRR